ncbi:hypothetical protein COLO4_05915 [Corchorus olitorius]|uniref:Uncharacterized protein n=1 Tax=Corchorus olitorius TaxID=93759 RepID=A0A1R3KPI0_9ROSI|nr:hypothetical protein COLO4_05915 [Corchorus olitorius]
MGSSQQLQASIKCAKCTIYTQLCMKALDILQIGGVAVQKLKLWWSRVPLDLGVSRRF